jgi:cation-transporting ATPase 13A1
MLKFGPPSSLFLEKDLSGNFIWRDISDKEHSKVANENINKLSHDFSLCLEGPIMEELALNKTLNFEAIILQITIFARVSPNQKEHIIKIIKESGKSVLMCGDGTNDVGALKKSDVGIALVGLKDEPSAEEAKAEKERKDKLRKEAMMKRQTDILQMLNTEDDTEFKSGDACIAAPFTNKFSNSLKCGKEENNSTKPVLVITIMRQGICTMTTTM